jgi:hypothetical protein
LQIELSILIPSAEISLLLLVMAYLAIAIGIGSYRLNTYLKRHPNEKQGKDYHFQHSNASLTLSGFSLTAIALLITIQYSGITDAPLVQSAISPTLTFFSLSFLFLILSPVLLNFRFVNFFVYIADVFFSAGLLAIACGFLVFFGETTSWTDWTSLIFGTLVFALFLTSLINYSLFESIVRPEEVNTPSNLKVQTTSNANQTPSNADAWIATESNVKTDFEESRRCLLNSYHSYVQTHAGYLIALIVGFFAVLSAFKDFYTDGIGIITLYGIAISTPLLVILLTILFASGWITLRILYWSTLASAATTIPIMSALEYFNRVNKPNREVFYRTPAPCTQIIQIGIRESIKEQIACGDMRRLKRHAINTARDSFWQSK